MNCGDPHKIEPGWPVVCDNYNYRALKGTLSLEAGKVKSRTRTSTAEPEIRAVWIVHRKNITVKVTMRAAIVLSRQSATLTSQNAWAGGSNS